jgi:pyruvate-formate lyase-activating enzyme
MNIQSFKSAFFDFLNNTNTGHWLLFRIRQVAGRLPAIDYHFPSSISIEIAGLCNLSCVHCPSHNPVFSERAAKGSIMELGLFYKLMDEIDASGPRLLSLHKVGEPLLHPGILDILKRVKTNQDHQVTLITNGHFLNGDVRRAVLDARIDRVLFSIGAGSESFYRKVRGPDFYHVIGNILSFLELCNDVPWNPEVIVQIINLPEYPEMQDEIRKFRSFWEGRNVKIVVYGKLTWGVLAAGEVNISRYPCLSLWRNVFINANGTASACCMDWDESLLIGDGNHESIKALWAGMPIRTLRQKHLMKQESEIRLCHMCNYWSTVSRLREYTC